MSVDYMFICRGMVVQFNNSGYSPQRLQLYMLYKALVNDTSLNEHHKKQVKDK